MRAGQRDSVSLSLTHCSLKTSSLLIACSRSLAVRHFGASEFTYIHITWFHDTVSQYIIRGGYGGDFWGLNHPPSLTQS